MVGKTISVNFISDNESQKLNKEYRGKDYPTDVLSFNYESAFVAPGQNKDLLGEIYINVDRAKEQAGEYENSFEQEIAELAEHGMLHILGVHHDGDDH